MNRTIKNINTEPGTPLPFGANVTVEGTLFSIFSRNATSVILLLFHSIEPDSDYIEIELDPEINKTGDIWHIFVREIGNGQVYGYKIGGPYEPLNGHRFNKNKLLIDPYSRAVTMNFKWDITRARGYDPDSDEKDLSFSSLDSTEHVPKSIVIENRWDSSDRPLNIPYEDTIIYELHVRGFTMHESSGVERRGTYLGLTEKIGYLKNLGITSVELLPVQEFDDEENININPATGEKLKNFWGYSTLAFFAPKGSYSNPGAIGQQVTEFREMIKAFHDAGIEVILDVVFNHTSEGDWHGPTISFRGIDNSIYYMLHEKKRFYKNYSGCGNTFNCNHPLVREFILECLRYWVIEMKVDGFRFDLASILGRDRQGNILSNPPLIDKIEEDPILRNTKIIAEAWDAAGAYQVGNFPGRWADWNGKYRDDVRRFWRGDPDSSGAFATRFSGSSDLYNSSVKGPLHSINFITCHDGFTLNDLVSYNKKHNIENGEDNRDGENYNLSSNYGFEGIDAPPPIERARLIQIKNFIATLLLSQGVPMILAGDEFRRTQRGNNNSYCHDNEISWVDWTLLEKNSDLFRFTKKMISFRKTHHILRKSSLFTGVNHDGFLSPDITWYDHNAVKARWDKDHNTVSALISGEYSVDEYGFRDSDLYLIFNATGKSKNFKIPDSPMELKWERSIDTSLDSPEDILDEGSEIPLDGNKYRVNKMSTVVFITQPSR